MKYVTTGIILSIFFISPNVVFSKTGVEVLHLKTMTFNIRYASAKDGENSWNFRKNLVVKTINSYHPDILGIQEAELIQNNYLKKKLLGYQVVGFARDDGKEKGEFSSIFFLKSKFRYMESKTFWYSDTPDIAGSKSWGNFIPRICTWVRLEDKITNKTFYVYNSHWDHISKNSRFKSANLLLQKIKSRKHSNSPVIVMGDFNSGGKVSAYARLLNSKPVLLKDSFMETHPDRGPSIGTFHGFTGKAVIPRIDAILVSTSIETLNSSIIETQYHDHFPSDHYPLTASVIIN